MIQVQTHPVGFASFRAARVAINPGSRKTMIQYNLHSRGLHLLITNAWLMVLLIGKIIAFIGDFLNTGMFMVLGSQVVNWIIIPISRL